MAQGLVGKGEENTTPPVEFPYHGDYEHTRYELFGSDIRAPQGWYKIADFGSYKEALFRAYINRNNWPSFWISKRYVKESRTPYKYLTPDDVEFKNMKSDEMEG